jgi:HK97 family phage major capsid protein
MSRLDDINARLAEIQTDLLALESTEASRSADLSTRTAEETAASTADATRSNELLDEFEALTAEAVPLLAHRARVEAVRTASFIPSNRERGSQDDGGNTGRTRNIYDIGHLRNNPLNDSDTVRSELISRAYDAIEDLPKRISDDVREQATRTLETVNGDQAAVALHLLTTGAPAYRSAFRKVVKGEQVGWLQGEEAAAMRASMSLTTTAGGFLLPFELDPTIILTNAGTSTGIRSVARVEQVTQNVWHGVSSAGVTAEWTSEASEATDASPTFAQPTVTCYKADAYLQASFEFLQDSNIESQVGMLVADAKERLEATAFATGNGTSQPKGIVTALQAVTASRTAANTNASLGVVDVYALDNALGPRWRENATFVANKGIYNLVRQLGTSAYQTFWVDFGGGIPAQLIGYPTKQASDMTASLSSATASNDDVLILGDFKQYLITDRIGMSMVYEPLVKGSNARPIGSVGWYTTWRVGADALVASAFQMLRV